MKHLFTLLALCLIFASLAEAQIRDNRFTGISVYSGAGYSGTETKCLVVGNTYTFPNGFNSIKVYGPYRLVNSNRSIRIQEDDPHFSGSGTGTWTLEVVKIVHLAIAYTGANYTGQAKFIKPGLTQSLGGQFRSIRMARNKSAKIGYYNASGLQTCILGEIPSTSQPFTRIDISTRYNKCAYYASLPSGSN